MDDALGSYFITFYDHTTYHIYTTRFKDGFNMFLQL